MHKTIVSALLLLGAGVALGAVSQRVLVTRDASPLHCADNRCVPAPHAPSDGLPAAIAASSDSAGSSTHASVGTSNATLLASKPMPGPLPQAEPSPSAWITPFTSNEAVDITPLGQDVVVKQLMLPTGRYTVLATMDTRTNLSGFCVLEAIATGFYDELDVVSVGASEVPGWDPRNEIQVRQRISLQGAVAFVHPDGGEVRVVCRSFFNSAHTPVQMEVQRPVLSAQLQRAIVLAPP